MSLDSINMRKSRTYGGFELVLLDFNCGIMQVLGDHEDCREVPIQPTACLPQLNLEDKVSQRWGVLLRTKD